jgi:hypothetical protein
LRIAIGEPCRTNRRTRHECRQFVLRWMFREIRENARFPRGKRPTVTNLSRNIGPETADLQWGIPTRRAKPRAPDRGTPGSKAIGPLGKIRSSYCLGCATVRIATYSSSEWANGRWIGRFRRGAGRSGGRDHPRA